MFALLDSLAAIDFCFVVTGITLEGAADFMKYRRSLFSCSRVGRRVQLFQICERSMSDFEPVTQRHKLFSRGSENFGFC